MPKSLHDFRKETTARGVADGLAYLHTRNIVHGALCPDKIMLTHKTCIPKLTGFGYTETRANIVEGRARDRDGDSHIPPKPSKDPRDDVYAYGTILIPPTQPGTLRTLADLCCVSCQRPSIDQVVDVWAARPAP